MYKVFNNWKVIILSLLGATTFWFFNALNKDYDARISYPIEFVFDEDSVVVMKPLPSAVVIDVSSGGWNLLRKTFWFNVTPVQIALDNPTEIEFYTRSSLKPIIEEQLSELNINYLVTDTVFINIEKKKSKYVKLEVDSLAIDLAKNHRITSPIHIVPDSAQMIGPKSFIDTVGQAYKLAPDISDISKTFNRDIRINVPNEKLIRTVPEEVRITFEVERFERLSVDVEVEPINFPEDSSVYLKSEKIQIFYTVSQSDKRNFHPDEFELTADLTMLNEADSTVLAILVYHPEEAIEIDVIPENLKVIYAE